MPDDRSPERLGFFEITTHVSNNFMCCAGKSHSDRSYKTHNDAPFDLLLDILEKIKRAVLKGEEFATVSIDGDQFIVPDPAPSGGAGASRDLDPPMPGDRSPERLGFLEITTHVSNNFTCCAGKSHSDRSYKMHNDAPFDLLLDILEKIKRAVLKGEEFITVSIDGDQFIVPDPAPSGGAGASHDLDRAEEGRMIKAVPTWMSPSA